MVQIIKTQESMAIKAQESAIVYQVEMMKALVWLPTYEWKSSKELVYQRGKGICLLQWMQGEKKEEEILEIIDAFLKIQREIEPHLMDEEKLICDPEWIFWEPVKKALQVVYIPWDFQTGITASFLKRFSQLLWIAAVQQKWQNERLILMLYRMQITLKHNQNQPQLWTQWLEREKKKIKERDAVKEQALDILTEEAPAISKKAWFHKLKGKFPIAIR